MKPRVRAPFVKICGLTRTQDVRVAVEAGVDAIGFVFTPRSKRFIDIETAAKLSAKVPAFISRVGLFMDQDVSDVRRVLQQVSINLLQFHGSEQSDYCEQFGLPYMKAVSMTNADAVKVAEREHPRAAALLLDSHHAGGAGGTGEVFDWSMISSAGIPLVLAGGLSPANVHQAVREVRPWGVDVSSGVEEAPGLKDPEKIRLFIEEAKREH